MRLQQYLLEADLPDMNRLVYKGTWFWAGVYNVVDNEIMAITTYENAENSDFHHSMYMPQNAVDAMAEEEAFFFWVEAFNTSGAVKRPPIRVDWHTNTLNKKPDWDIKGMNDKTIIKRIQKLVKII